MGIAKYPSGLVVKMKHNPALAATYPNLSAWNYSVEPGTSPRRHRAQFLCVYYLQLGEFITQTGITSALVDPKMVQHVQDVRNRYGTVLTINSGYRTPAYNRTLEGSSATSRHIYGDAIDFSAPLLSTYNSVRRRSHRCDLRM